jgi:hypothetical protein
MQQDAPGLWQVVLQDAIDETDPRLARTKLIKAEFAVFNRMYGFVSSANASEAIALFDALDTIRTLSRPRR